MDAKEDAELIEHTMQYGHEVTEMLVSRERLNAIDVTEAVRALMIIQLDRDELMDDIEIAAFIEGFALHIQWTHQRQPWPRYQEIPTTGKKRKKVLNGFITLVHKWLGVASYAAMTYEREPAEPKVNAGENNNVDLKDSSLITITFKAIVPDEVAESQETQGWMGKVWAWLRNK